MPVPALKTIILVEDDLDIQEIGVMSLEDIGEFEVTPCSSGQEALDKAPLVSPDLIFLDVMMPGMDGPTTLQRLRQMPETINIPVIFLTAKSQPHEVAENIRMGAVDVISKPFDPVELCQKIEVIWKHHHD